MGVQNLALQRDRWAFMQEEWHGQKCKGSRECGEGEGKGSLPMVWWGVKDQILRLAGMGLGTKLRFLDTIPQVIGSQSREGSHGS